MNNDELIKDIKREIFKSEIKYVDNPIDICGIANNIDYLRQEIEKLNKIIYELYEYKKKSKSIWSK